MLRQEAKFKGVIGSLRGFIDAENGQLTTVMAMTLLRVVWAVPQVDSTAVAQASRISSAMCSETFWRRSPGEVAALQQRGSDLRYTLDLTLEEAVFGVEKTIRVPRLAECAICKGSGAKPDRFQNLPDL